MSIPVKEKKSLRNRVIEKDIVKVLSNVSNIVTIYKYILIVLSKTIFHA